MRSASFCCSLLLVGANSLFAPRAMLRGYTLYFAVALHCSVCGLLHASAAYCAVFAGICNVCVLCTLLLHTLRCMHVFYIMFIVHCFLLFDSLQISRSELGGHQATKAGQSPPEAPAKHQTPDRSAQNLVSIRPKWDTLSVLKACSSVVY